MNTFNFRRVVDPIVTKLNGGYYYADSQKTSFSKRESTLKGAYTNLVNDNNPFKTELQKSNLEFCLDRPEISYQELNSIASTLNGIRFLNGNHVNRSIYWIEKIRKELFNFVDARPIELRKALIGLQSMQTSKAELVMEVDKKYIS